MYGLVVICSYTGAVPEFAGNGAIVVSPRDDRKAAGAIGKVPQTGRFVRILPLRGRTNVSGFKKASGSQAYRLAFQNV